MSWIVLFFSCCPKAASDCSFLTKDDREFHAWAAATGNARSPSVHRRVAWMINVDVAADLRRRQELWLVVKCTTMHQSSCTSACRWRGVPCLFQSVCTQWYVALQGHCQVYTSVRFTTNVTEMIQDVFVAKHDVHCTLNKLMTQFGFNSWDWLSKA